MKKVILLLSSITLLLTGCNATTPSDDGKKGDDDPKDQEVIFDTNLIGTWYINSSSTGTVSINLPFTVNDDETVDLGGQNFELDGYYGEYTNVFQFSYGKYYFMISYDDSDDEVDWAYQHGDDYDFGYACKTENQTGTYDYVGEDWPMDVINTYLGTSGSIPAFDAEKYYVDLFNSSIYNCKSADIEMHDTTLESTKEYINILINNGYTFYLYSESSLKSGTFYVGYDSDKTYTLRIINFDDSESHIFVYKYNENIKS